MPTNIEQELAAKYPKAKKLCQDLLRWNKGTIPVRDISWLIDRLNLSKICTYNKSLSWIAGILIGEMNVEALTEIDKDGNPRYTEFREKPHFVKEPEYKAPTRFSGIPAGRGRVLTPAGKVLPPPTLDELPDESDPDDLKRAMLQTDTFYNPPISSRRK